jgi:hypothetical protein
LASTSFWIAIAQFTACNCTGELDEKAVLHGLEQPPGMLRDVRIDDVAA